MKFGTMQHGVLSVMIVALAACRGETNASNVASPSNSTSQLDGDAAAVDAAELNMPTIPTQAEADAKAEAAINRENADRELEQLQQEIGGG